MGSNSAVAFAKSKKTYDAESLYEYALGAIGRRMRTVAELKRLMRQRTIAGDAEAVMDEVMARLKERRYLNDAQYAGLYSNMRKENDRFGRQRVVMDLKAKGVHGDVIDRAVGDVYEGVDEEKLAREFLEKKRVKRPVEAKRGDMESLKRSRKEAARVFRLLARAGFRTGTIIKVLKKWDVDEGMLSEMDG